MKLNQQLRNLKEEVAPDRITLRQMQRDRMMREQFNRRRAGDTSNDNGAWAGMTSSPFQDMQLEPPSLLRPYRCSFFTKKLFLLSGLFYLCFLVHLHLEHFIMSLHSVEL